MKLLSVASRKVKKKQRQAFAHIASVIHSIAWNVDAMDGAPAAILEYQ